MNTYTIIIITLLVFITGNIIAFIYSWLVLYTDMFKKYRIQEKKYKPRIFLQRLPLIALNIFLILALTTVSLYYFSGFFNLNTPSAWWIIPAQILIIAFVDDIWFYAAHWLLHANKFLLRNIHSIHHRAVHPHPLEYMYEHPLEWMAGSIGVVLGLFIVSLLMPVSIYAFWAYGFLRNIHEMNIHSGIHSFINPYIPFLKNSEDHDLHHSRVKGNYSSMFTVWDRVFETTITK